MKHLVYGLGQSSLLGGPTVVSGTTPFGPFILVMEEMDIASFQIKVAPSTRAVVVNAADAVVAGTHTWTFANAAFVAGDVGGTITVSGATNPANNGTFTIASRTSGTVIVTGGTQTNETFNNGTTTLLITKPPVQTAAPLIEVSNDYSTGGYNALVNAGTWTDVTSLFLPAASTITVNGSKYLQAAIGGRALRITITPSSGESLVSILAFAKGNS